MKLVGYSDPWSVAPGESISFMVSSDIAEYDASLVRLVHGDPNPAGPGPRIEKIPSSIDCRYAGCPQGFRSGSHVIVPDSPLLDGSSGLTLRANIWPTTPGSHTQGLLTKWDQSSESGYALELDENGALQLLLGGGAGRVTRVGTERPLRPFTWYAVEATWNPHDGTVRIRQSPRPQWPGDESAAAVTAPGAAACATTAAPFVMAGWCGSLGERIAIAGHFNGKIDQPVVLRGEEPVASWDFSLDIQSDIVTDVSANGLHGRAINMPMRAATGHNFTGNETCWRTAPQEYGAIFFHDDDLADAEWKVAFTFAVPDTLKSGVYAVRVRDEDAEDSIPFFVRPPRDRATAELAVLVPTFSYLAYGSEHITWRNPDSPAEHDPEAALQEQDHYAMRHRILSLYDHHADGTGNHYASRRRPLVNIRPGYNMPLIRAPHQLSADLHLIDWLEHHHIAFDVITDDDLHAEGAELRGRYRVVVSGSHHEYWSTPMLDALERYLAAGGRLVWLSGNGIYWPVGVDPARPYIIEVRRGQNGTGTWRSAPGESFLATTGEPGGLWRDRGRAPQRYVGVGMAASGFDGAQPFRRLPASFDAHVAWIFDGVGSDEPIGDAGLVLGGAGGLEVDRADVSLGTPAHAYILATADGYSDSYTRAVEEVTVADSHQGGASSPYVRSDMVFFDGPDGGGVFSVGSITWDSCLSTNDYRNAVSRITENVIRGFLREMIGPPNGGDP